MITGAVSSRSMILLKWAVVSAMLRLATLRLSCLDDRFRFVGRPRRDRLVALVAEQVHPRFPWIAWATVADMNDRSR